MAEQDQDQGQEQKQESQGGGQKAARTAMTAAAAAAATGVATYAARKAFSHRGDGDDGDRAQGNGSEPARKQSSGQQSVFASAAAGGWDAARDTLVPLAEDAAEAAGRYVAEHAPEFVRDRVVPKFIESFNNAKG